MKKEYKINPEKNDHQLAEPDGIMNYKDKIELSLKQAKEGKTIKVTTDEELKKLLDDL